MPLILPGTRLGPRPLLLLPDYDHDHYDHHYYGSYGYSYYYCCTTIAASATTTELCYFSTGITCVGTTGRTLYRGTSISTTEIIKWAMLDVSQDQTGYTCVSLTDRTATTTFNANVMAHTLSCILSLTACRWVCGCVPSISQRVLAPRRSWQLLGRKRSISSPSPPDDTLSSPSLARNRCASNMKSARSPLCCTALIIYPT